MTRQAPTTTENKNNKRQNDVHVYEMHNTGTVHLPYRVQHVCNRHRRGTGRRWQSKAAKVIHIHENRVSIVMTRQHKRRCHTLRYRHLQHHARCASCGFIDVGYDRDVDEV